MTTFKDYSDLYKHPEWQKKRLKILERDSWKCWKCWEDNETLAVHHCYYKRGAKPWEYPDGALITLCQSCHEDYNPIEVGLVEPSKVPEMLADTIFGYFGYGHTINLLQELIAANDPSTKISIEASQVPEMNK